MNCVLSFSISYLILEIFRFLSYICKLDVYDVTVVWRHRLSRGCISYTGTNHYLTISIFNYSYEKVSESEEQIHVKFNKNGLIITMRPLRLDFLVDNQIAVSVNSKGLMNFEHYQAKKA